MGQGFYTVLAWGIPEQPSMSEDTQSEFYDAIYKIGDQENSQARMCYEAKQQWCGFFIAEGGSGVGDEGRCELMSYSVLDAEKLLVEVAERWPERLATVRRAWDKFYQWCKTRNIELPPPRLMLVNDYD